MFRYVYRHRIPPPFGSDVRTKRPVPRRTAHVNCHDPVRVRPKLPPLLSFAVPTGDADTLYLTVSAGQHFFDRAAAGGTSDRVMLAGRRRRVMPCAQPEVELVVR